MFWEKEVLNYFVSYKKGELTLDKIRASQTFVSQEIKKCERSPLFGSPLTSQSLPDATLPPSNSPYQTTIFQSPSDEVGNGSFGFPGSNISQPMTLFSPYSAMLPNCPPNGINRFILSCKNKAISFR